MARGGVLGGIAGRGGVAPAAAAPGVTGGVGRVAGMGVVGEESGFADDGSGLLGGMLGTGVSSLGTEGSGDTVPTFTRGRNDVAQR